MSELKHPLSRNWEGAQVQWNAIIPRRTVKEIQDLAGPNWYFDNQGSIQVLCSCDTLTGHDYVCPACGLTWQVAIVVSRREKK